MEILNRIKGVLVEKEKAGIWLAASILGFGSKMEKDKSDTSDLARCFVVSHSLVLDKEIEKCIN